MNELVTKKLLKAFGDKSKQIFKLSTKTTTSEGHIYAYITTDLDWDSEWSISLDVAGKGVVDNNNMYTGDIKFFCNVNNSTWKGNGYCLEDNDVVGVFFQYEQGKVALGIEFSDLVGEIAVDIVNYSGQDTSNVLITGIELCDYKGDWGIYNAYVLGRFHQTVGSIGEIIRLRQQSTLEQFVIVLPDSNDPDTVGVARNVPVDTTYIESVNDSKWSKYLKSEYELKLKEGDLKSSTLKFGGSNNLELEQDPLEINNSVQGYTNYQEGDWVGKVKVNSKGLVTAVEKDPELPKATETTLGVVQVGYKENLIDKRYPVKLDADGNAYVHVPWDDTDTWNKVATESDLGLIKLGFKKDGKKYPVELNSNNKAYVEVPWTDTITEIPVASETTSGTIKLGYEENDKNYPIEVNDQGQAFVNVPWESGENGTYDIATADTAGLIKVGLNSNVWWENAVKLDVNGNAYVNVGTPVYTSNIKGSNTTKEFSYGFNDYEYTIIDPASTSKSTIDIVLRALNGWEFKGVLNKIHRISNQSQYTATIKVSNNTDTTLCNMFDAQITSNTGLELPAGKTLELVFTFWDVNDVSFNGGFSV